MYIFKFIYNFNYTFIDFWNFWDCYYEGAIKVFFTARKFLNKYTGTVQNRNKSPNAFQMKDYCY